MKSPKTFNSQFEELGTFAAEVKNEDIKNETMFFNCDLGFAYENGQEITKSFIDNLPEDWKTSEVVFDSRVHMLMQAGIRLFRVIIMMMYHVLR